MSGQDLTKDILTRGGFSAAIVAVGISTGYYSNLKSPVGAPGGSTFFLSWIIIIIIVFVLWIYMLKIVKDEKFRLMLDISFVSLLLINLLWVFMFLAKKDITKGKYISALLVASALWMSWIFNKLGLIFLSGIYLGWTLYACYTVYRAPGNSRTLKILPNKGLPPPMEGAKVDALGLRSERALGALSCFNQPHSGKVSKAEI